MWLAIGKELDQEGFSEVLASRKKGRRGFVIDEDVFLKMSCDLETYVRLLSLIGSGRLKVRMNGKGWRIGRPRVAFMRRGREKGGEVGSECTDAAVPEVPCAEALDPDGRMNEKFCPKCYLFRTSDENFCIACGTKLKEMKLDHRKG